MRNCAPVRLLVEKPRQGIMVASEIALGIETIDAQHEELVDLFNRFAHAIENDAPLGDVEAIVQRAIACANAHFEAEEELIARTNYPHAEDHKFQHRHMRLEFTTLAGDALAAKGHDPVTLEDLADMRAILMEHITGPDRQLAEHLKAAGVK